MAAINHPPYGQRRALPVPVRFPGFNWWVFAAILIAGLAAMFPVLQNSMATSRGFDVQRLQAEQTRINGDIRLLEADVAQLTSLPRIQRRASEIGLGPGDTPIYVTIDEAGPAPAKIPSEYLPEPAAQADEPESWWHSLLKWVRLGQ